MQDIEMTESYGFKDSFYSCRLSQNSNTSPNNRNNQNKNSDSTSNQNQNSNNTPQKNKKIRYKCYQCGGDAYKSSKCGTCRGLKSVNSQDVMVGLLYQVMMAKLGNNCGYTVRIPPKLEVKDQNKGTGVRNRNNSQIVEKGKYKQNFTNSEIDSKIGNYNNIEQNSSLSPRINTGSQRISNQIKNKNANRQYYSEGNSMKDSNSLHSSLDSLDTNPKNARESIKSKQKQKSKNYYLNNKINNNYNYNPHFKQQISEIKEESCAAEEHTVICNLCGTQGEIGTDYLQCKICKNFYICIKCYEERVKNDKKVNKKVSNKEKQQSSPKMKMKRQTSVKLTKIILIPSAQNQTKLQKSEHMITLNKERETIFDSIYQIHEHPLTRCCSNNEDFVDEGEFQYENYIDQYQPNASTNIKHRKIDRDEDYIENTYGKIDYSEEEQADLNININKQPYTSIMTPATFKNLFKSYDNINTKNHSQQCPASPKSQKQIEKSTGIAKLQISTIKQERESPSPSQNSLQQENSPQNKNNAVGEIKQFIKFQSLKESQKEQSDFDKNISMTISNNYQSPQSQKRIQKQKEENSNHNSSNCVSVNVSSSNPSPNSDLLNSNKVENNWNSMQITIFPILNDQIIKPSIIPEEEKDIKIENNMLIAHRVINRDFSQWSQYSKVQTEKQKSADVNSVDTQQKPVINLVNSCEAQSVLINSHDVSDTKSNKQVSLEDKQIQKQKNKSYTQKKVNKFVSIRHNNNSNDKQIQESSPQNNFLNDSQKIQQKISDNSISVPVPINLFQLSSKNEEKQEILQQKINKNEQDQADYDPLAQPQCYECRFDSSGEERQEQKNSQVSLKKQKELKQKQNIKEQNIQQQENDQALHRLFHRTQSYLDSKQCSYCGLQIRDTSIYMTCTTCAKNNKNYELCDGCSGSNKIINQHGTKIEKHIFKPNLYKKPGISNLQMEQQKFYEYKEDENLYSQNKNGGRSEQDEESDWRKSISLQPEQTKQAQKQQPKPQQIQKIQIKQREKEETHQKDHKKTEPNIRESNNIKQDLYSSIYRQKKRLQCLKNQKYKEIITNILGAHFQNTKADNINRQSNNLDESGRWLSIEYSGYSNSNKNSINNNYNNNNDSLDSPALKASNPGIWISQANSAIHNSSTVIPNSLMSFNNNSNTNRKSLIDDLNNFQSNQHTENSKPSIDIGAKEDDIKKQKNTSLLLSNPNFTFKLEHNEIYNQSNINIITTTKTINSEQAASSVMEEDIAVSYQIQSSNQISLLSRLKSKSHNQIDKILTSSNRQDLINKSNQYLEVRQSPKKSIGCQTGGSPDRSEMSSRIKVDCGQTDSEHEYDKNIMVEEESLNQSKKTTSHWVNVETEEKQLQKNNENRFHIKGKKGRLMRLSSKGNIIGKQQVESEQISQNQEENLKASMKNSGHHLKQLVKGKVQKLKKKKDEITNKILHKIGHKSKNYQEQFQGQFYYQNPQQIAKQFHIQSNKQSQKRQVRKSRSRSQDHTSRSSVMSSMKDKKEKLISSNSSHEEDINTRLKMDFLGTIQKSEKLERSEGSIDQNDEQKPMTIHFNFEDYSKGQDKNKSQEKQAEETNSRGKYKQKNIDRDNTFVFEEYRCDKCSEPPVGFRYHCKICQDYDLCRQCYGSCNKFHEHNRNNFEQINREMQIKSDLQEQKKKEQAKNIKDQIIMGLNPRNRQSYVSRGSIQNVNRLSLPGSSLGASSKMTQSSIGRNTPSVYVPKFQSSVYNMGRSSNI